MLKIGITGGIGSGKSTICKVFETLNIPIYYADIAAAVITNKNNEVKSQLIAKFGDEIYSYGMLDRKKLARLIFNNSEALAFVNSVIHPAVKKDYENWLEINKSALYTLKEAAILFESGANTQVDKIISVYAPQEIKIQRVMKREQITYEEVLRRISSQMPDEEKMRQSHFVIYNDVTQLVIPQVLKIHNLLINSFL